MLKRLIFICLAITALVPTFGQSVLGIPFGTSYYETLDALRQRFGRFSVHEDQGNLQIYDFKMGDFEFKFGELGFQYSGGKSYLNSAHFQTWFASNETALAKNNRDYLYYLISQKYEDESLKEFQGLDGFKNYLFGHSPKDPNSSLGAIYIERGEGNDGVKRLYLNLYYFPIEFVPFSSDF